MTIFSLFVPKQMDIKIEYVLKNYCDDVWLYDVDKEVIYSTPLKRKVDLQKFVGIQLIKSGSSV